MYDLFGCFQISVTYAAMQSKNKISICTPLHTYACHSIHFIWVIDTVGFNFWDHIIFSTMYICLTCRFDSNSKSIDTPASAWSKLSANEANQKQLCFPRYMLSSCQTEDNFHKRSRFSTLFKDFCRLDVAPASLKSVYVQLPNASLPLHSGHNVLIANFTNDIACQKLETCARENVGFRQAFRILMWYENWSRANF